MYTKEIKSIFLSQQKLCLFRKLKFRQSIICFIQENNKILFLQIYYHRQHLQIFESFTFYLDLRIHSSISMCLICCSKYFTFAMVNFYYYTRHCFVIPMQTCYFLGVSVVKPICAALVNKYFNTYIYFTQHNIYFNIDFSPSMFQKMPIQESSPNRLNKLSRMEPIISPLWTFYSFDDFLPNHQDWS